MADKIVVEAAPRDSRGKNEARRLRVTGNVPAVLYGAKGDALALSVNAKQVGQILRSATGHNTLFQVAISGKEQPAIVKDWQVDPVTGNLLHVDLLRVSMDVRMRVKVPVHTFGDPAGVKVQGGVFEVVSREVELERVLAHVVALKVEEEKPVEAAVEGAAPAEPEVIKKGKKEVEGEEGAEAEKQEK